MNNVLSSLMNASVNYQVSEETGAVVAGAAAGTILGMTLMFFLICLLVWYVFQAIADWKIFAKAGKPGWHSLVPFLNLWDEVDMAWNSMMAWVVIGTSFAASLLNGIVANQQNPSGFLTAITSVLMICAAVVYFVSQYKLCKAFGKGTGFFIGLLLLNPIFKLILGFGDAQYQGPQN